MPSATDKRRILLAGCGQLGCRIGLALAHENEVFGLRRNAAKVPSPLQPVSADLLHPESLVAVLPEDIDTVIYCLTPNQYDDEGYRAAFVEGLDNLLTILEGRPRVPDRVFFISSTAVYHQDDDSWVDETSSTEPERFSGRRLLEGEDRLARSPIPGTTIRFSGIYGNARRGLLDRIKAGKVAAEQNTPFGNRIHEDDCVGVIVHLVGMLKRGQPLADCYLASDCEPVRQAELIAWVCSQIACDEAMPAGSSKRRAGSKRCDNSRLLECGYRFRYPTFREGYRQML